jgi:hypothetical protein
MDPDPKPSSYGSGSGKSSGSLRIRIHNTAYWYRYIMNKDLSPFQPGNILEDDRSGLQVHQQHGLELSLGPG